MSRGVNQIQNIFFLLINELHLDSMTFDSNATLAFQIHVIKNLGLHVFAFNGLGILKQTIGQGALAMVYMSNNTEIADIFHLPIFFTFAKIEKLPKFSYIWHTICTTQSMTVQEINKAYNRIEGSLNSKELKNAFDFLQKLIYESKEYSLQDKLTELHDTYKYMLRYRVEGMRDPMQSKIYNDLMASTYELADDLKMRLLLRISSVIYFDRKRIAAYQPLQSYRVLHDELTTAVEVSDYKQVDALQLNLFNQVWLSGRLTREELSDIRDIFADDTIPFSASCQIVSALLLGLQACFDDEKVLLLCDAAMSGKDEVRARALIAILITLYLYHKRIGFYPAISNRLEALAERGGFVKELRTIILRFILSRETEKITQKIQNEIIPEMMKMSPKLNKKINMQDFSIDQLGDEMNPDWQNMIENSEFGNKMKEFSELQMEGADVMHSSFIHLKSFPFFSEMGNWFLPFNPHHSAFGSAFGKGSEFDNVLETMALSSFMCNSDKYSLYFSIMQLPEQHRKMMMAQFDSQAMEMIQDRKEEFMPEDKRFEYIVGQYVQDLYRFFKIHPRHLDFLDLFALKLDFHNLPQVKALLSDNESLTIIAEYYLRKGYIDDALVVYERLALSSPDNEELYQKIGYCKQMKEDVQGALEAYLHADLLNGDSKWVIRRIAGCYRALKQPEKALGYYQRYEALSPDNLSVTISIGHCHLELKNFSEALKCYFKVEYLDPESHKAWRPIAWCSFLTGKFEQARNYYGKIMGNAPSLQDMLNAGHTEWALQNVKGAINFYKMAVEADGGDFHKFMEQFTQDIPDLLSAGIEEQDIPLLLDELRYSMDGSL